MATLDDIAQELGISKGTVSKALNGAKDVSKKMQQAVLEKAVELGYSRICRKDGSHRIAVFIISMEFIYPSMYSTRIMNSLHSPAVMPKPSCPSICLFTITGSGMCSRACLIPTN